MKKYISQDIYDENGDFEESMLKTIEEVVDYFCRGNLILSRFLTIQFNKGLIAFEELLKILGVDEDEIANFELKEF